jgi:hypothetical protein
MSQGSLFERSCGIQAAGVKELFAICKAGKEVLKRPQGQSCRACPWSSQEWGVVGTEPPGDTDEKYELELGRRRAPSMPG